MKSSPGTRIRGKKATAKATAVAGKPRATTATEVKATKRYDDDGVARNHVPATEPESAPGNDEPRTLTEFMAMALLMETEAAQRYAELADAMETHNNRDVATLFRRMAAIEGMHAQKILATMKWREVPVLPRGLLDRAGFQPPEAAPSEDVHYLMQPYQALQLALAGEQRAEKFFAQLARVAKVASVRKAARELRDEESEHVALVKAWMEKVPKPATDWADDPDPPSYMD